MSRGFHGKLLDKTAKLGLPNNQDFVITHSAALAERGVIPIDDARDIDGVASEENMKFLRRQIGWRAIRRTVGHNQDRRRVRVVALIDEKQDWDVYPWDFSDYDYQQTGNGRAQLDELKEFSDQDPVTGIWVARTNRGSNRPKDIERLQLIEEYIRRKS